MKITIRLLLLLVFSTLISGCLDITEELSLNKNGSGQYELRVDPGRFIHSVSNLIGEDSIPDNSVMPMLDSTFRIKEATLRNTPGISDVKLQIVGFSYSLSYHFENMDALNAATANPGAEGKGLFGLQLKERIFSREGIVATPDSNETEDFNPYLSNMVLSDGTYTAIYHLPGKVLSQQNDQAFFRDKNHTVVLKVSLLDIVTGDVSVGNVIHYHRR